jgi:hypothetical protein
MLRCSTCGKVAPVSEDDPDASFGDMVDHAMTAHRLNFHTAALSIAEAHDSSTHISATPEPKEES